MKKIWLLMWVTLLLTWGCATTKTPPPQVTWDFEKDAIELSFKADIKLNYKDRKPHTMVMSVYQLKDPNTFSQLSGSRVGIYDLLECRAFDQSVATVKQFIVNPGQEILCRVDRAQGARFVAVVAGYYSMDKDKIIRLYEIPAVTSSKRKGFLWLRKEKIIKPGLIQIALILGAQELQDPQPVLTGYAEN